MKELDEIEFDLAQVRENRQPLELDEWNCKTSSHKPS